ncbi:outer membrane lipid asymmetry maintenance protein MlaD [Flavisphingomonas formosensis]|uniref:outer membrane lipid asymmetry maintenance protein MlaD n=1 Tax=Flavisphingomonas formosensis TaxID=861534 RepID=UPI0012FCAE0D|nr:outer membrane lipid asymmetry maintenance protein MlaD [Sphingomonas formosensis]
MKALVRENLAEAVIGVLVVLLALWFANYALQRTGGHGSSRDAIHVTARFPNASGISVGTEVRVAGLKVGTVTSERLDPQSYQAEVVMALDPAVKLPSDSSAAITSEGLLGSTFIAMMPGGDTKTFKDGDTILDTQGSVDLMGMIGSFINRSGSGGSGTPADSSATPAAPKP